MDQDSNALPANFNPEPATGDVGSAYEVQPVRGGCMCAAISSVCPAGSHMGNGCQWADSPAPLGYGLIARRAMSATSSCSPQARKGSDSYYGHVAIVEKINDDSSIVTSESGASLNGGSIPARSRTWVISVYSLLGFPTDDRALFLVRGML